MRSVLRIFLLVSLVSSVFLAGTADAESGISVSEFTVDEDTLCDFRDQWMDDILDTHRNGTWAKMDFELSDDQLGKVGLPSREVLNSRRYPRPTLVTPDGRFFDVPYSELEQAVQASAEPTLATFAGNGCLGIRPGALLLSITSSSIGWCSMAHAYGSAGSYDISTAGHCGNTGDVATVIAGTGNRGDVTGVILLDFGRYAQSTDGGLGRDWAMIDIDPAYQGLVTPTMCFWGGPRGSFTKTGAVAGVKFTGNPGVSVNPDPFLAQTIVHYGHGAGIGAGGTPRVGEAIAWGATHFMFSGAITPGDSGSGANTLLGDEIGANMEAAGIITHIWVDPLMRQGIGIMGGTRVTSVGTPANGQIVPYPIPISGLP